MKEVGFKKVDSNFHSAEFRFFGGRHSCEITMEAPSSLCELVRLVAFYASNQARKQQADLTKERLEKFLSSILSGEK